MLASEAAVKKHGLTPLARIVGYGGAAQAPEWFTTAPAKAMDGVLAKTGLKVDDIDLFEINEAFGVVAMVSAQLSKLDIDEGQRPRRRRRARSPDRRERRAHRHDAAPRPQAREQEARPRVDLHRRRRSARDDRRARLSSAPRGMVG